MISKYWTSTREHTATWDNKSSGGLAGGVNAVHLDRAHRGRQQSAKPRRITAIPGQSPSIDTLAALQRDVAQLWLLSLDAALRRSINLQQ